MKTARLNRGNQGGMALLNQTSKVTSRRAIGMIEQLEVRQLLSAAVAQVVTDDVISPSNPELVINEQRQAGQTINTTDVQIWQFQARAGYAIEFDFDQNYGSSGGFHGYLRLFDSTGKQLAANDTGFAADDNPNDPWDGANTDPLITYEFTKTGTYYLGVSGNGNKGYNANAGTGDYGSSWGQYSLTTYEFLTVPPDTNDTLSTATPVSLNTTVRNADIVFRDVDMYRFTVAAGQRVMFDVDNNGSPLNGYMRLFDSTGNQLGANDNAVAPGETLHISPFLDYTFARGGTYYVAVSGKGNEQYDPITGEGDRSNATQGGYSLDIRTRAAVAQSDGNDRLATAAAIPINSTYLHQDITFATDVDMFKFTARAGQRLGFDVDTNGSPLNGYMRLFNAAGTQLAANDNGAAPGETLHVSPYIEYTFATAGTYYVGISGKGNQNYNLTTGSGDTAGSTGAFTLTMNDTTYGGRIDVGGFDGSAQTLDVKFDGSGNQYVFTQFVGTVDFDPNNGVTTLFSRYGDRALSKYGPDGNLQWARIVPQTYNDPILYWIDKPPSVDEIAVDPDGYAYVAYNYTEFLDTRWEWATGLQQINPDGTDGFLEVPLYPFDEERWVTDLAIGPNNRVFYAGAVYERGSLAVYSPFERDGTISYRIGSIPMRPTDMLITPSGMMYVIGRFDYSYENGLGVLKYDLNTNQVVWRAQLNQSSYDTIQMAKIAYDEAHRTVYVTGQIIGNDSTIDFDPTSGVQQLNTGKFLWTLSESVDGRSVIAGKGVNTIGTDLAIDDAGNAYIGTTFTGTIDVNLSPTATANFTSKGGSDIVISKYSRDLVFAKGFQIGGAGDDQLTRMWSNQGDVFLTGSYRGRVDFDPGVGTAIYSSQGIEGGFVLGIIG